MTMTAWTRIYFWHGANPNQSEKQFNIVHELTSFRYQSCVSILYKISDYSYYTSHITFFSKMHKESNSTCFMTTGHLLQLYIKGIN